MIFTITKDPFDTDVLGFNCAKIEIEEGIDLGKNYSSASLLMPEVSHLIKNLHSDNIDYARIRFQASNYHLTHALEASGFLLVDSTVELTLDMKSVHNTHYNENVREARPSDIDEIQKIAKDIFLHNRFFNDPLISNDVAHVIYVRWAKNCLTGAVADEMRVYENTDGKVLGFIAIKRTGHVELIGVSKAIQRSGIGRYLVASALQLFTSWGINKAQLETQATNIPALRLYESFGYKISNFFHTFRWARWDDRDKFALLLNPD